MSPAGDSDSRGLVPSKALREPHFRMYFCCRLKHERQECLVGYVGGWKLGVEVSFSPARHSWPRIVVD